MRPISVLLTNNALAGRGGSETYIRDVALALLERGHRPVAFSLQLGEVAAELLQRKPNYSVETARQQFFFCNDPGFIERFVEGLRVAGIVGA